MKRFVITVNIPLGKPSYVYGSKRGWHRQPLELQ